MRTVIALACLVALPGTAAAFHEASEYGRSAIEGGGGGLSFSGSPRAHGYDCAICHTDASGAMRVAIASDPPELATERTWQAGRTYRITVALTDLHRGLDAARDRNGFALEVLGDDDQPVGALTADGDDVLVRPDESIAMSAGERLGATTWSLAWTAPEGGVGDVHFWVAGVDGNGGGSDATDGADPYGDDAWSGVLSATGPSPQRAAGVGPTDRQGFAAQGCRQAGGGGSLPLAIVVLWLAGAWARARARRFPVSSSHANRAPVRGGGARVWVQRRRR